MAFGCTHIWFLSLLLTLFNNILLMVLIVVAWTSMVLLLLLLLLLSIGIWGTSATLRPLSIVVFPWVICLLCILIITASTLVLIRYVISYLWIQRLRILAFILTLTSSIRKLLLLLDLLLLWYRIELFINFV